MKIDGESLQGYHRPRGRVARYLPAGVPEPAEPVELLALQAGSEVPFAIEVPEPAAETQPETPHSNGKVPQVPHLRAVENGHDPGAELERLQAKFPDLTELPARCRCPAPVVGVDDDGDAVCTKCGRAS